MGLFGVPAEGYGPFEWSMPVRLGLGSRPKLKKRKCSGLGIMSKSTKINKFTAIMIGFPMMQIADGTSNHPGFIG